MNKTLDNPTAAEYQPPYLAASIAACAVFALYAVTLSPTTAFWDASEYIVTAHTMGIPHPPGNPLFVLLARTWDLLLSPLPLSTAVRINLFSAMMSALAHGFWFLLAHRLLAFFSGDRSFRLIGAAAATLMSATAFTVWNQSNVNEKVYTVSLFTIALLSWLAFRWRDSLRVGRSDNLLLLTIFILALSIGNHLMTFLVAPALLVFVLVVKPRTLANWKLHAFALVFGAIGVSVQLYLPLRAQQHPIINEAAPTCPSIGSAMVSVVTFGRAGCENLSNALTRRQFAKPSVLSDPIEANKGNYEVPRSPALMVSQIGNYLQYFDWQWARSVSGNRGFFGGARPLFTLLFVGLGIFGALRHFKRDRKSFWYLFTLFVTLSLGLTFYLNFRYGYTYPLPVGMDSREVRERDYFFIASFSLWGLWAGVGVTALWQWFGERIIDVRGALATSSSTIKKRNAGYWAGAACVIAIALTPLALNWNWASRSEDWTARDWAHNVLNSVEPYGLLFTNGDNDTFPLWYVQEVEGLRRDVTVMVTSYLNTPWYPKQLRDLTTPCRTGEHSDADATRIICQRPYDAANGPRIFTDSLGDSSARPALLPPGRRQPTRSILQLTDEQIDQIASNPPFRLGEDRIFKAGNIESRIPADEVILPAHVLIAHIIANSLADRPIYFATTTQAYQELGLDDQIVRVGLAYKLVDGLLRADPARGIHEMPQEIQGATGRYVDLPKTAYLTHNVFVHHKGFPDNFESWVDVATQQIPLYYGLLHLGLAQAYAQTGEPEQSHREGAEFERFMRLANTRQ
jgi:hypothetical protein